MLQGSVHYPHLYICTSRPKFCYLVKIVHLRLELLTGKQNHIWAWYTRMILTLVSILHLEFIMMRFNEVDLHMKAATYGFHIFLN